MPAERQRLLSSLTANATVLSPDRSRSVTFDREGRFMFYFRRGRTYKRGLGSDVHLRFRDGMRRDGVRRRRRLPDDEAWAILSEVHDLAQWMHADADGEVKRRLEREILPWSPARLVAEARRFERAYRPITILPPDQYLAIVLQATEGCTWNACTFCNFYMDRPFQVKSPVEFRRHAEAVKDLLGNALSLRRGIFIADGNALAISNRRLGPLIAVTRESFPERRLYGFVDLYSGERRRLEEWKSLAEQGLDRVYIGMETGLDELLQFVNKPGSARQLEEFVCLLKAAGLRVSLIVMVGLGGQEYRRRHREASLDLLSHLPLDRRDLIYLSPFIEHQGSLYQQRRVAAGLTPMTDRQVEAELQRCATQLRAADRRVGRYDIREFVY